jgi:DNA replication and repair protein RecF
MIHYTSAGIHKDDLIFEIDGFPIKKFGSQGQQKSFLIALKLAQFEFVKNQSTCETTTYYFLIILFVNLKL